MGFCADDHGDWWSAQQAVAFNVPASPVKDRMASGSQSGEVCHRCARDKCTASLPRELEQVE
jgi:hypothetical protein